ncbi:B-box type zinc finger protein ncl-1-like [Dreissena polymorpha]|uniref:B box-type domain-containing protein n=1 Tax=Dreissena polymorpha TaxID=45954 RepID=A0A9D4E6B1_DREPO|nr:B-box type zinc finger protein ncl-1-like [Dreissena polymorpha]XP_052232093.1 B-box type zinc finger protein ncl-1-like [Dreissena polymorpha]KAH3773933.1 hypothetical protein DPMN_175304 [Dreissena polymorpha]
MDCSLNECGVCASESVVAFCENCNFKICETCFQLHRKSTKLFQNHVAFLIDQTKTIIDESIAGDNTLAVSTESFGDINTHKCATHKTENLIFFCTEHTETLCGRCVFSSHKPCKVVDLFEVNVDDEEVHTCKSHLQNLVENLKSTENKIEKNKLENNACKQEFGTNLQRLRTEFINWFDRLQSKCEKQCIDTFETNAERLTQAQICCQEHIERIQKRQEFADILITKKHVKKLYILLNEVKKEIEEVKLKINWLNSASTFNSYIFKRSNCIEEFLNSHTFEIGGLEEWCSGSDELLDDSSSLTVSTLRTTADPCSLDDMPKGGKQVVSGIIRVNALSIKADRSCSSTIPPMQFKSADIVSQGAASVRQHPPENSPRPPPRPIRQTSFHGDVTFNQDQAQSLSRISTGSTNEKSACLETIESTSKIPEYDYQSTEEHHPNANNKTLSNGKYKLEKHGTIWCIRDLSSGFLYLQRKISATSIEFKGPELLLVDNVYYHKIVSVQGRPKLKKCDESD